MIQAMQAALGVSSDGQAGPQTAKALQDHLASLGFTAEAWGRGDSVILDVSGYQAASDAQANGGDWMAVAASAIGLHERNNATALNDFLASDGYWAYEADDIAWCGEFVDTCLRLSGHKTDLENPLGARNWSKYGERCEPKFGAIMVFWRGSPEGWKGHVGFMAGADRTHFHILGGNQGNRVSVSRIARNRFLGARWPIGAAAPARFSIKPGSITVNEA